MILNDRMKLIEDIDMINYESRILYIYIEIKIFRKKIKIIIYYIKNFEIFMI